MIYIFGGAFDPPHDGHSAIVRAILHHKNPLKIIVMPSGKRDDKMYHISDYHRLEVLRLFVGDFGDDRIMLDDFFIKNWQGEMITKDVDVYAKKIYGENITHIFGADIVPYMSDWDTEEYASKKIHKLIVPRLGDKNIEDHIMDDDFFVRYGVQRAEVFDAISPLSVNSTNIRTIIPEYTDLKKLYENNPKYSIPGLSQKISRYILENRLYRNVLSSGQKPKILLHVCCGPDVTMPIHQLKDEYDIICFWYDPNIEPRAEYDKRFEAFKKVCEIENIPFIKGAYDVKHFHNRIKGYEHTPEKGEKCTYCYDMRMFVSARLAKRLNIECYTSSLNTSPKKDLKKLFHIGKKYADRFGVKFLDIPFRKRGGFEYSVEYTKKHDIYRQSYCGCALSIREGGDSELKRRMK